jgi:hypothetical protein
MWYLPSTQAHTKVIYLVAWIVALYLFNATTNCVVTLYMFNATTKFVA